MPSITMTIDQLELSPHNVRTHRADMLETAAIERSLLASGQMFPLLVHPWKGRKDRWGVFAGGRRWRSFKNLIARGDLPVDHPIDVVVRDMSDAELTELSLAENLVRRDLRPYEIYAAVLKAHRRGASPDEIARETGQELIWVKRALRLATLAPPLLAALESDRLSVDQAQAFAATEDQALQARAWKELCGTGDMLAANTTPATIRARLKVGDPELQRLLRFVGDAPYRAAGGRFELDLFAGQAEQRGRVADESILRDLVDVKLGEIRREWREALGREVRFQNKPPQTSYGSADQSLEIEPTLNATEGAGIELPPGDVVGTIDIGPDGTEIVRWWWASHAAKRGKKPAPAKTSGMTASQAVRSANAAAPVTGGDALGQTFWGERQRADAQIKEQEGLTADGVQIMRSLRRAILRAAIVDHAQAGGTIAADYLVWAQLRMLVAGPDQPGTETAAQVGMQRLHAADPDGEPARPHVDASNAGRSWRITLDLLRRRPFITEPDLVTAFTAYCATERPVKDIATAVVAAIALERSLDADGYRIALHEHLACHVGLDRVSGVRRYWEPTAAFLDLLPIAERRAIAQPFLEPAAFASWTKLKSAELTPMVLRVVDGSAPSTRRSMQSAAANWVHPLLAFVPPGGRTLAEAFALQPADDGPDPNAPANHHFVELAEAAE